MRRFRQVNNERIGKFQTHGNRFSNGKVHVYRWDPDSKTWNIKCRPNAKGFDAYYGQMVDADTPVTCKKCL